MVEGIAVGVVLMLLAWLVGQPKPKAFLKRLRSPAERLLGGDSDASAVDRGAWDKEFEAFRDAAAALWNPSVRLFERVGFHGMGSSRDGLHSVVRVAPWPDDEGERTDAGLVAEAALSDFAQRMCRGSGQEMFERLSDFEGFDEARRLISRTLKRWSARIDQQAFEAWLREVLDWQHPGPDRPRPRHESTMKYWWYLEIALAEELGHACGVEAFFPRLRNTLERPLPMSVTVDKDGYVALLGPDHDHT